MSDTSHLSSGQRARALLHILLVLIPIVVLGSIGTKLGTDTALGGALVNLGYVLAVIVGWRLLRTRESSWPEIGLARPASWLRTILLGVAAMLGAVVVWTVVQNSVALLASPGAATIDESRFNPIQGNLPLFLIMLLLAWTTIGFGEEMIYRAFITTRLIEVFLPTKVGTTLAALGSSLLFGLAHYFVEGPIGILSNGAFGLLFAWIYLRSGRNLWITIIGHALLNTLRFLLLFIGAV